MNYTIQRDIPLLRRFKMEKHFVRMAAALFLMAFSVAFTGCGGNDSSTSELGEPALEYNSGDTVMSDETEVLRSERSRELSPDVTDSDQRELVAGNNEFALDLYHTLRNQEGNLFYSPYSISLALAMTYAGARGETEQEMGTTCHFTLSRERLHPAFNALDTELAKRGGDAGGRDGSSDLNQADSFPGLSVGITEQDEEVVIIADEQDKGGVIITDELGREAEQDKEAGTSDEKGFRLNIANSVWGQSGYSFMPDFLDVLAENYGAGMRLLDFAGVPEDSRVVINDWISENTEGRIEDMIPRGTPLGPLVLTNAIYFNAAWESPFQEEITRDGDFHLTDGTDVTVPMMSRTGIVNYGEGGDYQAAELVYDGGETAMLIILPGEGRFGAFEDSLTAGRLDEITEELTFRSVAVSLPRFSYESETLSLRGILSRMGMPTAFTWPGADFSGMDGTYNLFIGDVLHRGFISVDESGTEAAAATVVAMAAGYPSPDVTEFTVNRPFIFFIRDISTNTILFTGRILNPVSR
ncbi:MAG TPA: serpin family protein [Desulfobacterales bacterium]|nr:serpin family protein [Desulfobacterales bacterium]